MIVFWRIKRLHEKLAEEARNKQLVMAQKMELVGILAGGAVHDLKNLLAIIIGYSKIAVQNVNHEEANSKPLEKIKNTAMTAVSVVKQILAFTRQKYDKTMATDLINLVNDILEILKISTPAEVKITWQPPEEKIRLYINPTKFQQVVMNLCLNAVQAIPGQGEVCISLSTEQSGHIILEVTDNGDGMEEETASRIFDPLYTTKEPGKGTGLGLFVVKQIVAEQKGKIAVKSKPGAGTTFRISFPCRESA
jgi:signal transduction histidine kinase